MGPHRTQRLASTSERRPIAATGFVLGQLLVEGRRGILENYVESNSALVLRRECCDDGSRHKSQKLVHHKSTRPETPPIPFWCRRSAYLFAVACKSAWLSETFPSSRADGLGTARSRVPSVRLRIRPVRMRPCRKHLPAESPAAGCRAVQPIAAGLLRFRAAITAGHVIRAIVTRHLSANKPAVVNPPFTLDRPSCYLRPVSSSELQTVRIAVQGSPSLFRT